MLVLFKNTIPYIFIMCDQLLLLGADMIFIIYIFIQVPKNLEQSGDKNIALWNTV